MSDAVDVVQLRRALIPADVQLPYEHCEGVCPLCGTSQETAPDVLARLEAKLDALVAGLRARGSL